MSISRLSSVFVCLLVSPLCAAFAVDGPLLDFKLDYKTTKKHPVILGWEEFDPPSSRPTDYYLMGTFSGMIADLVKTDTDNGIMLLYAARLTYDGHNIMRINPDD